MDIDDVLVDNAEAVARFTAWEGFYIAIWTRPSVLPPATRSRASKEMRKSLATGPLVGRGAQEVGKLMTSQLSSAHQKAVEAISSMLTVCKMRYQLLDTHELVRTARLEVDREATGAKWRALLPGDRLPVGYPQAGESDATNLMYPALSRQIFPREGEILDRKCIVIGDKIHCPMTIELMPQTPQPFSVLFKSLISKHFPWRVSFLLSPDGLGGLTLRSALAGVLGFTNSDNKKFNEAVKDLEKLEPIRFSICWDTWVHVSEEKAEAVLRKNASTLAGLIQNWGSCDVAEVVGDPLLGVAGTIPAIMPASPARVAAAPLHEAVRMLPLTRVTSPWQTGSLLFRTPDGKVYPYEHGSSKQKAWFDIAVAPMGSGKSVLLNGLNFSFILQPGNGRLPWLSILDIGPSSRGLIEMIRQSLPEDKKYLAVFRRVRMENQYSMNPFDTPLGFRKPHPRKHGFLKNILSLLATPIGKSNPPDGIDGLAELCIEMAYDKYSDAQEPKLFDKYANDDLTNFISEVGLHIDENTTWWEITDYLFLKGYIHQAYIAQRYAVPVLPDIASIAKDERVKRMYHSIIDGEDIIEYFWRHLIEAVKTYPILRDPTQFDLGDAQIISLDLDEVSPRGSESADRQTLVMFMLARDLTTSSFFFQIEDADLAPEIYKNYHHQRTEAIHHDPKRLVYDEAHRYIRFEPITRQISVDIREGRKWFVSIGIATQDIIDFPQELLKLVSTLFVLGANTKQTIQDLSIFGLNDQCTNAIMRLGKPSYRGSKLVAKFMTDEDAQQVLMLTLGSQFILATSTTSEDMALRDSLVNKIGQKMALKILAKIYPQGTIKHILEQKKREIESNEFGTLVDPLKEIEIDLLSIFYNKRGMI